MDKEEEGVELEGGKAPADDAAAAGDPAEDVPDIPDEPVPDEPVPDEPVPDEPVPDEPEAEELPCNHLLPVPGSSNDAGNNNNNNNDNNNILNVHDILNGVNVEIKNQNPMQASANPQQPLASQLVSVNTGHHHNGALAVSGPCGQVIQYNWQASKPTVKERLAFMFNNEIMSDVHFIVGKGSNTQRIPAHKFVLSVGSAVFDAMFNGGIAITAAEVELPDVEPAAFLALLRFLYSDEVQIGPETVMTTLYTAKKYAVPALERACVDFLKNNLSSDNAFMLLTQARLFDEPQLAALCLETIDKNTTDALSAESFADIDMETLCVVLERDTLGIRECKLFTSVTKWAVAECGRRTIQGSPENIRVVLDRALHLIRFPLMSVEEFAIGAAQSGVLLDREVVELFLYFTVNPKPSVAFLDNPRCCMTGKEQVVSRFCQIESRWGYSGTSDRIR
jgi:BTB/POZ domain-containing protein 1/2